MFDLDTLTTFTPANGIYGGVNKTNFKSIELWLQTIKENGNKPSNAPNVLGLFGPASTGKTTTAGVVAKALNQSLVPLNCAALNPTTFFESVYQNTKQRYPQSRIHDIITPYLNFSKNSERTYILQNCVILLDECHELSTRNQGQLLSVLDGSTNLIHEAISKTYPLGFRNVSWILSTTDSGKLLYPLSTRLHSIILNEYSEEDVVEIIKLNYPMLTNEPCLVLGRAAKLVPRIALDLTKQYISIFKGMIYNRETALSYVSSIRQTNEYGLDSTDEKILSMLKGSRTALPKAKQLDKQLITNKLNKFDVIIDPDEVNIKEAINLQKQLDDYNEQEANSSHMPRSRQDISTFCRLYDMRDLEIRLGYMEKLGVISKTKSGILWRKDVN